MAIQSSGRRPVELNLPADGMNRLLNRHRNGDALRGGIIGHARLLLQFVRPVKTIQLALESYFLFVVVGADQIDFVRAGKHNEASGAGNEKCKGA